MKVFFDLLAVLTISSLFQFCSSIENGKKANSKINSDSLKVISEGWKNDVYGCEKFRNLEMAKLLVSGYNLTCKDSVEVKSILGIPNMNINEKDESSFLYYFNTQCDNDNFIDSSDYCKVKIYFEYGKVSQINYICN